MNCTIMIVGGGPAGASTWLHLHKYAPHLAEQTILIDKQFFPRDKLCAGALNTWSMDTLDHLGVGLDFSSLSISHVEFRFEKESHVIKQDDWFKIVHRLDFDHTLIQTALNRGLKMHAGESVLKISHRRDKLKVKTNKGEYTPEVIVGADGTFSRVRRSMMPHQGLRFAATIQVSTQVKPGNDIEYESNKILLDLTPVRENLQGYVWHVPCKIAGEPKLSIGIGDFRIFAARPRANLKEILIRDLQSRNVHPEEQLWESHPIHWFSGADRISSPHAILVGDAAGIEPAFGGGIHLSLSYGDLAARAIIDAYDRRDFSFQDYRHKFNDHQVGRSIFENSRLALKMYSGKTNPLDTIRDDLSRQISSSNLLSLLLSNLN